MQKTPRLLVISHNCFSQSGSNGRTLSNFFQDWPKENLAQFYIHNEISDSPVCNNYFRVLDTEALKAFLTGAKMGTKICQNDINVYRNKEIFLKSVYNIQNKRSSFKYFVRNLIWNSNRWKSQKYIKWLNDFSPQIVLLQAGDYEFMLKIALDIAKQRKIPLVIYNSEDYYFKDRRSLSLFYNFYRHKFKKRFENLIAYASHTIYICDMLQETYNKRFIHESTVIMTSTDVTPYKKAFINQKFVISYFGNISLGRHEPLIEIANALQKIDKHLKLDIYGKIANEEVKATFEACKGINYINFISYTEVLRVIQKSDLLVHVENFSKFYQWDLRHAFSTKIADCLASGKALFVYGPESIASIQYLKNNNAACVVTDFSKLNEMLTKLISNEDYRNLLIHNAITLAKINHDRNNNIQRFHEIIKNVLLCL